MTGCADTQRARKSSPLPQHTHPHSIPKPPKITAAASHPHPKVSLLPVPNVNAAEYFEQLPSGPDFTVPPPASLLVTRPPIAPPPIPGPSKPTDVNEDFSKAKQPTQVQVTTFYTSIDPWLRLINEEDVGFLEWTADEVEPFVVPKLGRHYLEVWEEGDMRQYGTPLPGFSSGRLGSGSGSDEHPSLAAPQPNWEPSTLMESDLGTEDRGHGPLTERLISALLPMPDSTVWKGVKAAEDAMEGRPGGSGAAAARREKMNVGDLEERIRDTMRFHGLLDRVVRHSLLYSAYTGIFFLSVTQPDYAEKVDDPIATALRHTQEELRLVIATNKARRRRLAVIVRDRLGYQEYLDMRDSIDKNITSTFTKLQKKDAPKTSKKKKKLEGQTNGNGKDGNGAVVPLPNPAAIGFGPDEDYTLVVNETLSKLMETRRQWVDVVGGVFDEMEMETPGRVWGIPRKSVYEGLEADVKRELENVPVAVQSPEVTSQTSGKGKEKARSEMDVIL
jgi:transcriptional adapter 3